jgi:hypothetical protein
VVWALVVDVLAAFLFVLAPMPVFYLYLILLSVCVLALVARFGWLLLGLVLGLLAPAILFAVLLAQGVPS